MWPSSVETSMPLISEQGLLLAESRDLQRVPEAVVLGDDDGGEAEASSRAGELDRAQAAVARAASRVDVHVDDAAGHAVAPLRRNVCP